MPYEIPLFDLNFDDDEQRALRETLRSRWISMGQKTALLEQRFAEHLGGGVHAVAVSSGTAALHLAMVALGLQSGDEVIVPSLTFVATANAVRYTGATPVFADITGMQDLSIDPQSVLDRITPKTRAIIAMHYGGFACDMDALAAIARDHNLSLVEDAAHAPASTFHHASLGTLGDIGCFSFFSNKNMTCAEGGMLVTKDAMYAQCARSLRSHGMTTLSFDRAQGHATSYDVTDLGYNYRLDDLRASLALVQLDKLRKDARRRQEIRDLYIRRISRLEDVIIPYVGWPHISSNYIFPIVIREGGAPRRDGIRSRLADNGIQTSVHYPPAHHFSIYAGNHHALPMTDQAAAHEITLPLYAGLTEAQIDRIVRALKDSL